MFYFRGRGSVNTVSIFVFTGSIELSFGCCLSLRRYTYCSLLIQIVIILFAGPPATATAWELLTHFSYVRVLGLCGRRRCFLVRVSFFPSLGPCAEFPQQQGKPKQAIHNIGTHLIGRYMPSSSGRRSNVSFTKAIV